MGIKTLLNKILGRPEKSKVKITNGFPLIRREEGVLLAGILLSGQVNPGDFIVTAEGKEVPILDVERHSKISPQTIHIGLLIPNNLDIITYKDFGKTFKIKNVR